MTFSNLGNNMQTRIDYLIKDNLCKKAIEEYNFHSSVSDWLAQYSELYNSVTITPEGLPPITSSHFAGEIFKSIQQFAYLYSSYLQL
jgi:hypothetical protein